MSSNQTPAYGLNQWSLEDQVIMAEFNADNQKVDTALSTLDQKIAEAVANTPRIKVGSYVGTGIVGTDNPSSLTFDFEPMLVIVTATERGVSGYANNTPSAIFIRGASIAMLTSGNYTGDLHPVKLNLIWSGKTLSWYTTGNNVDQQLNRENALYHYFAIG